MNIIRLAFAVCLLCTSVAAQLTTLSQTASPAIVAGSVSCNAGGLHDTNSYIREYDLAALGITTQVFLRGVDFGVEQAIGATGSQPVIVNIYSDPTPGNLTTNISDWVLLVTQLFTVLDKTLTLESVRFNAPSAAYTPAGDTLIVEVLTPNGQAVGNSFFIGSNAAPQTAPSYLMAATCGATLPTDIAALGFPNQHNIIDLVVDPTTPAPSTGRPGTMADLYLLTGANGASDSTQSKTVNATAGDALTITLLSVNGSFSGDPYVVFGQITSPGSVYVNVAGTFGPIYLTTNLFVTSGSYGNAPIPPFGVPPLLGAGDTQNIVLSSVLSGLELGLQGLSLSRSATNGIYESTDHHIITLL